MSPTSYAATELPRHSQTSPVRSPPTEVICSTGIPKAGMLPHYTCSWDHALSFPSKRGQPTRRGDERGPQDQEWGKKLSTGPPRVISADFQEEGEPKSQKVHTRGTLLEKRKVLSHSTAHPSTTAPLRLLTQRVPSAYFLNLFFFPPFTFP